MFTAFLMNPRQGGILILGWHFELACIHWCKNWAPDGLGYAPRLFRVLITGNHNLDVVGNEVWLAPAQALGLQPLAPTSPCVVMVTT